MPIDFSRINADTTMDKAINPREIFTALPNKKEGKFEYPRDVQTQVWDNWFSRREEKDLVIKMNTGSGKTIVGLILLKSCLNERKKPAVYVVPDNYLVKQVIHEAENIGIKITEDENSPQYLSGKAILVINIYKLVNGKSVFGIGDEGIKIPIDSIIIDDAHACLDTIEEQFSLTIDSRQKELYSKIYECFKLSLHSQCETKALEIENKDRGVLMQVPFWTWQEKISEVSKILIENKDENNIKFTWPLIKESLLLSRCVISSDKIEITPHCIPIDIIGSIKNASRRIFMTATLVDDSILCSHFGIQEQSVSKPIIPNTAGDIGDRMILLPQVINSDLTDDDIKMLCKSISKNYNVVVIVPSKDRAEYWGDQADLVLTKDNLYEGVKKLRDEKVGLTVFVNRYDGIDLPKNACRLLVIDGLPNFKRLIDQIETNIVTENSRKIAQLIQKVEQGMGRGVRSSDDYCAVFLIGRNLTRQLYLQNAIDLFSPSTKAQIDLSDKISEQIKGTSSEIKESIMESIMYCLTRNQEWVSLSKSVLASLSYNQEKEIDPITIAQRRAFDLGLRKNYKEAAKCLDDCIKLTENNLNLTSYLKQCLAEYINFYDTVEAQKVLKSAVRHNSRIIKPLEGIEYHKLQSKSLEQAKICGNYLRENFDDPNKIIIEINGFLESLIFKPNTANLFEELLAKIARFIGFNSQRPENEYNQEPDVLWEIGNLKYFVIECKNGITNKEKINKHDCNQLNGSFTWFKNKYDSSCQCTPIMVHPSLHPEYAASLSPETRIINEEKLGLLKKNIHSFIKSLCVNNHIDNYDFIHQQLIVNKLVADDFLSNYTMKIKA